MTVEVVHVSQVYLECIGTLESFEMVAQPLEFLSILKLRLPPLEVRLERRVSFPEEAWKYTLLSR